MVILSNSKDRNDLYEFPENVIFSFLLLMVGVLLCTLSDHFVYVFPLSLSIVYNRVFFGGLMFIFVILSFFSCLQCILFVFLLFYCPDTDVQK